MPKPAFARKSHPTHKTTKPTFYAFNGENWGHLCRFLGFLTRCRPGPVPSPDCSQLARRSDLPVGPIGKSAFQQIGPIAAIPLPSRGFRCRTDTLQRLEASRRLGPRALPMLVLGAGRGRIYALCHSCLNHLPPGGWCMVCCGHRIGDLPDLPGDGSGFGTGIHCGVRSW